LVSQQRGCEDEAAAVGGALVGHRSAGDPGVTDDERRTIVEMMATGTFRASR
jgi:hypothetical protein